MMKWIFFAIVCLAAPLKADTVFTTFSEEIIYGTDTLLAPGGAVVGIDQYVAWGDQIAPDIATDIQNDSTLLPAYPAAAAAIQSSATSAALIDDLTFLTTYSTPATLLWANNGAPPVIGIASVADPANIAAAIYPGYSLVSASPAVTLGQAVYSTGAFENPDTLIEGTVTFDIFRS